MPSTYTPSGGYEKQATGENRNQWGVRLNTSLDLLDERIDGVDGTVVTGNFSITISNALSSDGRHAVQVMTGTPAADFTVTLPARELNRWFHNLTGKAATITLGSGTTCIVRNGQLCFVYTDGTTGCWVADPTLSDLKPPTADVAMGGFKLTGLANATLATQDATPVSQVVSLIASATVNLPAQTGQDGKFLTTDGTAPSWATVTSPVGLILALS